MGLLEQCLHPSTGYPDGSGAGAGQLTQLLNNWTSEGENGAETHTHTGDKLNVSVWVAEAEPAAFDRLP